MKKMIVFALLAFASLCSGRLASAQSRQVQGQIPFDFTAGSSHLSAGEYRITYGLDGLVSFRNLTNGQTAMTFVGADGSTTEGSCKLIFAVKGDRHFLKQSACKAANVNFFIPIYRREKVVREHAAVSDSSRQIVVAMK